MPPFIDVHSHHPASRTDALIRVENLRLQPTASLPAPMPDLFSVGIHPWDVASFGEGSSGEAVRRLAAVVAAHPVAVCNRLPSGCFAVGELGFDRLPAHRPYLQLQQRYFTLQAQIAIECHRPLMLHCVRAADLLLKQFKWLPDALPIILHGFRGKGEEARQLLRRPHTYLSFGRYFHCESLQAAADLDRFFIETDEDTDPIAHTYQRISEALNLPISSLLATLSDRFFSLL